LRNTGLRKHNMDTDSRTEREKEYKEAYDMAWAAFGAWQETVRRDLTVYLGDSWTQKDKLKLRARNLDPMNFPNIRRNVKWISGYQRDHRLSIRYDPVEAADELTASQLTDIALWVMQRSKGHYRISGAFEGALKTGINLVNIFNDRNQDTRFEIFRYNQFLLDPMFTEVDLSDCHFGILRKHITRAAAKMLLPGHESEIDKMKVKRGGNDGLFTAYAKPTLYGEPLLTYDEFQQRTTIERKVIIVKATGEQIEWPGTEGQLKKVMKAIANSEAGPDALDTMSKWYPTVEVTALLEGKEMSSEVNLFGLDDFSFTPVMCYFDPEYDRMENKLQSLIHGLVDTQRASDKRMLSMTALFDMQIGAGLDVEQGALLDDEDAFKTGSGSPRVFKEGAIAGPAGPKYRDRVIPDIPVGMFQLHDIFDKQMPRLAGINEEMAGQPTNNKLQIAGVLAKLRAGAGLVGLRGLFDDLELSISCIGTKLLKLIQQYPPEKIIRILNQQPSPQIADKNYGQYDCVAVEGVLTDTQRNSAYAELISLKEMGASMGDPAPITWTSLIKRAPLTDKQDLMQEIQQLEQQKQQEQAVQQQIAQTLQTLAIEGQQAEIQKVKMQTMTEQSQAIENTVDAALGRAKTMSEIQSLEQENRLKLLNAAIELEKLNVRKIEVAAKVQELSRSKRES